MPDQEAELIKAFAQLAWPVLAAAVLARLFPVILQIAKSRAFAVRVGDMEISVQQASEQVQAQIEDLQNRVSELRERLGQAPSVVPGTSTPAAAPPRQIVWVDDAPQNNAFEIARLRKQGVTVLEAVSTSEALRLLVEQRVPARAVISDMGRREEGRYEPKAGIQLLVQLREAGIAEPFIVYSTAKRLDETRQEVLQFGGTGATASPLELLELLKEPLELAV